jgi:hypothetical protein
MRPRGRWRAIQKAAEIVLGVAGIVCLIGGLALIVGTITRAVFVGLSALHSFSIASLTGLAGVGIFGVLLKINAGALVAGTKWCISLTELAERGRLGAKPAGSARRGWRRAAAWADRNQDAIAAGLFLLTTLPIVGALVIQAQGH